MVETTVDKIAVITDSCADVPKEYIDKYNIFILPMVINCSDGEYRDGINISSEDVYEKLKTELPKTSSPAGEDILNTFEEVKRQGYNKAIVITLAGAISGTCGYLKMMAEDEEELEISVYDSLQGSIGIGAIAIQTAKYISEGMDFATVNEEVEKLIKNTKVFFSIDTLEYLQKGGRIGRVTAVAGAVFQIKPIMSFDGEKNGEIYAADKVRGSKQVPSRLLKLVSEQMQQGRKYNIVVADGGAREERDKLEEKMKEMFPDYQEIFKAKIGAALSVYLGSGLLGAGIQFID